MTINHRPAGRGILDSPGWSVAPPWQNPRSRHPPEPTIGLRWCNGIEGLRQHTLGIMMSTCSISRNIIEGWHKSGCKQEPYQKKSTNITDKWQVFQLPQKRWHEDRLHLWDPSHSNSDVIFACLDTKKNRFSSIGPFLFSWELSVFVMWEKLRKHHLQNEVLHLEAGWNFLRHVAALVALLVEIQIFDVVHRYTPNTLLNKDTFCETKYIYIPSGRFIIP